MRWHKRAVHGQETTKDNQKNNWWHARCLWCYFEQIWKQVWLQIRADSLLWLVHKKPENHCFRVWLPCRWRVTAVRACNFLSVSGTPTHHGMSKIWCVKADFKTKKQQKQVRSFTGRRLAVTELNFVVFIFNFKVKKFLLEQFRAPPKDEYILHLISCLWISSTFFKFGENA